MEPRIIKGRYASAVVYVVNLDPMSEKQIQTLCDAPFVEGEDIRIMPDAHAGKGCVIGYTQTIRSGKVCPSLVGVDISCGMLCIKLGNVDIDLKRFDERVKLCVSFGETKELFRPIFTNCICRDTMKQALDEACLHAKSGDVILLSPACSSFDQFKNYEERGRIFKDMVHEILAKGA